MTVKSVISNTLSNKKFAYASKGIMMAVVGTTVLKAVGRPVFIMADKKSDPETKKYTAVKELLYQLLCLGLTFAMVLPAQRLVFKNSKKIMEGVKELEKIKTYSDFKEVNKDINEFTPKAKELLSTDKKGLDGEAKEKFNLVRGADELASFVSSIVGLTIVAPLISHELLHPIMHAIGMNKKDNNIGKPTEIFLADAKVPNEKASRLNANA